MAKTTKDKSMQLTVQEQIRKHRELTAKNKLVSDSEGDEDQDEGVDIDPDQLDLGDQEEESFAEFSASYKKFHAAQQAKKQVNLSNTRPAITQRLPLPQG